MLKVPKFVSEVVLDVGFKNWKGVFCCGWDVAGILPKFKPWTWGVFCCGWGVAGILPKLKPWAWGGGGS